MLEIREGYYETFQGPQDEEHLDSFDGVERGRQAEGLVNLRTVDLTSDTLIGEVKLQ